MAFADKLFKLRHRIFPKGSKVEAIYVLLLREPLARLLVKPAALVYPPHLTDQTAVRAFPGRSYSSDNVREILVIKCDHIGDFLLALPAIESLHSGFPDASITLLCGPWNKSLAEASGLFERVETIDLFQEMSNHEPAPFKGEAIGRLSFPHFDIAIDLRVEQGSHFLLNYVDADFKAGFEHATYRKSADPEDSCFGPSYDFALAVPSRAIQEKPNAARHTQVMLQALTSGIVQAFRTDQYNLPSSIIHSEPHPIPARGNGPMIGINTGSGNPIKDWSLSNHAEVIRSLIGELDATVILIGAANQEADGSQLEVQLYSEQLVNLIGKVPLTETPGLIKSLDLFIGHDSGITHLAALLGVRTICIHAGTAPLESYGPIGKNVTLVKCMDLACAPCGLANLSDCPYRHYCMTSITPSFVFEEVQKQLATQQNRGQ